MKACALILASLCALLPLRAADYTFEWDANAPDENVVGYRLKKNGAVVDSPAGTVSKPIPAVPGDKFTVVAVNAQGTASADSPELMISAAPSAPGGVRVKVTVIVETP